MDKNILTKLYAWIDERQDEIIENLTPYTNLKIWCIDELLEGMN